MKNVIRALSIILVAVTFINAQNNIPKGWFPSGNDISEYEIGIDNSVSTNGNSCAYIKSISPKENTFGNLMQTISAEKYLNKRLKMTGFLKTENVQGWSGMWMRIDGNGREQLGFDNMQNRSIKGTTDWEMYEIVLDVPENSKSINFGILLGGNGKVWMDNIKIAEVDKNVPVTNMIKNNELPNKPMNLDFEE
ncbi:MAG: hypothetical protein KKA84_01895 [Bacteroidetes bacterium]|nr:hypothetical protein [Bacteroidota bacterium]